MQSRGGFVSNDITYDSDFHTFFCDQRIFAFDNRQLKMVIKREMRWLEPLSGAG